MGLRRIINGIEGLGEVLFPAKGGWTVQFRISTRTLNGLMFFGDGTMTQYITPKNIDYTSSTNNTIVQKSYPIDFYGNARFRIKDVVDIHSLDLYGFQGGLILDIEDFKSFIGQFINLYSFKLAARYDGVANANLPTLKGNLIEFPDSVERVLINDLNLKDGSVNIYVDFNKFSPTSKLKYFKKNSGIAGGVKIKFTGDLSKIPPQCSYFEISRALNSSSFTYSSSKVWPSVFDSFILYDFDNGYAMVLPTQDVDSLFNDMANHVTSVTGGKIVSLQGSWRTAASDLAVSYLKSLGTAINLAGKTSFTPVKMLDIPFQNSIADFSGYHDIQIGGGSVSFVAGRKGTDYAIRFDGTTYLKTAGGINLNSNQASVAFWIKTSATTKQSIFQVSANGPTWNSNNAFAIYLNNTLANSIEVFDAETTYKKNIMTGANINTGTWRHVAITIDRSLGITQNEVWIDGVSVGVQHTSDKSDNSSNFGVNLGHIGSEKLNVLPLQADIQELSLYNYKISPEEITALFNA